MQFLVFSAFENKTYQNEIDTFDLFYDSYGNKFQTILHINVMFDLQYIFFSSSFFYFAHRPASNTLRKKLLRIAYTSYCGFITELDGKSKDDNRLQERSQQSLKFLTQLGFNSFLKIQCSISVISIVVEICWIVDSWCQSYVLEWTV